MSAISIHILILTIFTFAKVSNGKTEADLNATVEVLVVLDNNITHSIHHNKRRKVVCDYIKEVQDIYNAAGGMIEIKVTGLKALSKAEDQVFIEEYLWKHDSGCEEDCLNVFMGLSTLQHFAEFVRSQTWSKKYDVILLLTNWVTGALDNKNRVHKEEYSAYSNGVCHQLRNVGISLPSPQRIAETIATLMKITFPTGREKLSIRRTPTNSCLWTKNSNNTLRCTPRKCIAESGCPSYVRLAQQYGLKFE